MTNTDVQKEALRQQMLLRALWRDARSGVLAGWTRDGERFARGLEAYRANAGALAERALAAACPTVQQLVGAESFGFLARAFWRAVPPQRGDIAEWGGALGDFIANDPQLASEPYLADVARLDWAVHVAERAADAPAAPQGIERLGECDPARLRLRLCPGAALLSSPHPIVTIWQAHRSDDANRFAPVRAAFAEGAEEHALVLRRGWKVEVRAVAAPAAAFNAAVLAGQPLSAALAAAGEGFDFEAWLIAALQDGQLMAIEEIA